MADEYLFTVATRQWRHRFGPRTRRLDHPLESRVTAGVRWAMMSVSAPHSQPTWMLSRVKRCTSFLCGTGSVGKPLACRTQRESPQTSY